MVSKEEMLSEFDFLVTFAEKHAALGTNPERCHAIRALIESTPPVDSLDTSVERVDAAPGKVMVTREWLNVEAGVLSGANFSNKRPGLARDYLESMLCSVGVAVEDKPRVEAAPGKPRVNGEFLYQWANRLSLRQFNHVELADNLLPELLRAAGVEVVDDLGKED